MRKILLSCVAVIAMTTSCLAGAGTITVKDSAGATQTFTVVTDGSGNFLQSGVLCDFSAGANCVSVDAAHGLTVKGEGTAGTATGGVVTVQGVASMTPLLTTTTLNAETTKVIGTVNQGTSPWVISGAVTNAGTFAVQETSGQTASGSPLSGNPVRVGLSDGTNAQNWLAGIALSPTAGVNGNNTGAVINYIYNGTAYVAQPGTVKGSYVLLQDAAGNARGANVNSSNQLSVSCDNGCTASTSITGWGGGTLGAMANYGTSPGAVLVPGVNAFVTNANANGQATMANSSPVTIASDQSALKTIATPATTGGLTTFFLQPAANDNHTNVKNGAGQVYWVVAENNSATVNYLRFYNAASGFNGCNSATGLISQLQIPASTSVGGINVSVPTGIPFSTGISICVTSGYATNDTTNATATAMSLTIGYN